MRRGVRVAQVGWRYATATDLNQYYGQLPETTVRAIVCMIDHQPAGIIGIAREAWTARYFSEYRPDLEPYLNSIVIMRAVKASIKFVREYPTPVYARAEHREGCRMLQRLGFIPTDQESVFIWPN